MRSYRRILSVVDLSGNGAAVIRRAWQMAQLYNASLAVASVVDYTPGFECDHVPFRTPEEMRSAIVRDVSEKLDRLVGEAGAGRAELIVAAGSEKKVVTDLLRSWQPDLVLVGSHAPHGLEAPESLKVTRNGQLPFDVLTVQMGKPSFAGRLIQALSAAF